MEVVMFYRNKKGLTLIELIIVMAIMAILASISYVSIQSAIRSNAIKGYQAQAVEATETCETIADSFNKGVRTFLNLDTLGPTATVNVALFETRLNAAGYSSKYEIVVLETEPANETFTTNNTNDRIYVYITGFGSSITNTTLIVKGAWYVRKGQTQAAITYRASDKKYFEGFQSLN